MHGLPSAGPSADRGVWLNLGGKSARDIEFVLLGAHRRSSPNCGQHDHRHQYLSLQAPAAEAEDGRVGGASDCHQGEAEARLPEAIASAPDVRASKPTTQTDQSSAASANADRKSAIVTSRRSRKANIPLPDTPEEHQRRGDAADALFREIVRRATCS